MAKIHNNPKLEEPRMPVILPKALEDRWLHSIEDELDIKAIKELIKQYPEDELQAHTVAKLRGKEYAGNIETIADEVVYGEMVF
jgi:putative SOS response-associated peptidase YedK